MGCEMGSGEGEGDLPSMRMHALNNLVLPIFELYINETVQNMFLDLLSAQHCV